VGRSRVTRWAAPVAFLAAITIGALVVRSGLESGRHHNAQRPTTTVAGKTKTKHHHHSTGQTVKVYTVVRGDTLATIATKTGTTVAELERLNPAVNPTALQVGQKIRVQ
jgi:LysM repeat protein